MKKRIYFLVPSVPTARKIVNEILLARIDERHIHVIAKEGTDLGDLPRATLFETSDYTAALQRGVMVGGLTGAVAGLLLALFPPARLAMGPGAALALALVGSGFGAWFSGMIGADVPSPRLERFQDALQRGGLLLLVDVPEDRLEEIEALVHAHHRSAHVEGVEPTIPTHP